MATERRPLLAVLVDADNIPAKHAKPILNEIANHGDPVLKRVYGDWTADALKSWAHPVQEHGMVAHQLTANTTGKNASDIGMVIDAMDLLHSGRFDGFALVSSDSDFTALANRIREQGLIVLGVGEKKTPDSLRNACSRFILVENISGNGAPKPIGEAQKSMRQAEDRLLNIIGAISDDEGWAHLGAVGSQVLAKYPDFDTRTYGFEKLSDLVKSAKGLEYRKSGTAPYVRRAS